MFKRIGYLIAGQFTAFVLLLLLLTGAIFLAVDTAHRTRAARAHLSDVLRAVVAQAPGPADIPSALPPVLRDRVRITDADGQDYFSGALYAHIPFSPVPGVTTTSLEGETYEILTTPFTSDEVVVGYIQVADRAQPNDLRTKVFFYVVITGCISLLTFLVGLFFARRSLKPAQHMVERLEQFTQDASHELRTPLTAVGTSLDLALATGDYQENVRAARKDLKDIFTLVDRLLDLARLDTFLLHREEVDLSSLVAQTVEKQREMAEAQGVTIDSVTMPNVRVIGDMPLIRQVVSNLLANAIKFNRPDGTVTVRLLTNTLTVRDTGKGIAPGALPHIFDRFYQEDAARTKASTSLGLGLALVKRIVDLHGWAIAAESEQGKGATFAVTFPAL